MPAPRILILGSNGGLGRALCRRLAPIGEVTAWTRADLDLEQPETIAAKLARHDFDVLLNPAGMVSPDLCEAQPDKARVANVCGPHALAEVCHARGVRLIHFSTDYVFSGEIRELWSEEDPTGPVNVYGLTKRDGELAVLKASPDALVARVSWLFGPDKPSHPDSIIQRALQTDDLVTVADKISVPTSSADIAGWIERLLPLHASGILHLCNSGRASWHSWAEAALAIAGRIGLPIKTMQVKPIKLAELTAFKARRPLKTVMSNERLQNLLGSKVRDWREALEDYVVARYQTK